MKLKFILLYFFIFAAAFFLFGFLLFPNQKVAAYLSSVLTNSNLKVKIDSVKPRLPIGLKFENIKFLLDQDTEIIQESFKVFLVLTSIFKEKKQIKFQSDLYQGKIKGGLHINSFDPFLFSFAKLFISSVKINDFKFKTDFTDIILNCNFSGEYKKNKDKKDSGNGMIDIHKLSLRTKNLFPFIKIPEIDFSDIELEFEQNQKKITITKCIAKGSIFNVELKGSIDFVLPVKKSRLNITGRILPDSPYLMKPKNMIILKSVYNNKCLFNYS